MKTAMLALALLAATPVAHAQIVLQAPPIPGYRPVEPGYRPVEPGYRSDPRGYPGDYWRQRREGEEEWRRRAEFREEEHRRMEWRRAHCVRDYRGEEFCRR